MRFMAVAAEAQGRGVAQALLEESKRVARDELGADFIALHVRREATGVARFYMRAGWERRPEGDRDLLPEIFLEGYLLKL
jgi:ribosomal protein S18 acetylase RimI-like enzyme